MVVGCNLDVPWNYCRDVKHRRSYSRIAVWVKVSVENTWYPVYASSKKQNMVCLSSGESELMALVGGACEGIATRAWNDCAVHGQLSSSGIRETQGCESTHSSRGDEGLFYAGLGDGTWTANLKRCMETVNKLLIVSRRS